MKQLLKENFVLIVGVALPFVVALSFFAAIKIGTWGIEPPQTPLLYLTGSTSSPYYELIVEVRDGQLYMRYVPPLQEGRAKPPYPHFRPPQPMLYYYDPVTQMERPLALPALGLEEGFDGVVPSAEHLRLSETAQSPDGYIFTLDRSRHSGGLLPELFIGGRRYVSGYVLQKGGYKEPLHSHAASYNTRFIGWVIDEGWEE